MTVEIVIYLLVGAVLMRQRRVLSGKKNGCFYGKNTQPPIEKLEYAIKNLHFIETPAWYTQFGGMFFLVFASERAAIPETEFVTILLQVLS